MNLPNQGPKVIKRGNVFKIREVFIQSTRRSHNIGGAILFLQYFGKHSVTSRPGNLNKKRGRIPIKGTDNTSTTVLCCIAWQKVQIKNTARHCPTAPICGLGRLDC
jgi:hypothetical protein